MSDCHPFRALFDAQLALSRLTPEQLSVVDEEAQWIRAQIATRRTPSPEMLVEQAPMLMRLLADMDDMDDL
ncbi:MAG: hypothetical protein ACOYB7_02920 [Mycobacterium sp.]